MRSIDYLWCTYGTLLLRVLLAMTFLYAGVVKMMDPLSLKASIARFEILPALLIHPMALTLPPLEALCALALFSARWKRQAAFSIVAMCLVFLGALISAAMRGIDVECSCFGSPSSEALGIVILRDCLLLTMAGALYVREVRSNASSGVLNDADECLHSAARTKSTQGH